MTADEFIHLIMGAQRALSEQSKQASKQASRRVDVPAVLVRLGALGARWLGDPTCTHNRSVAVATNENLSHVRSTRVTFKRHEVVKKM